MHALPNDVQQLRHQPRRQLLDHLPRGQLQHALGRHGDEVAYEADRSCARADVEDALADASQVTIEFSCASPLPGPVVPH